MAATIEVKYFNSFVLKKQPENNSDELIWNGSFGIPQPSGGFRRTSNIDNDKTWIIEEARIRGGYNNTSTDYGVRAYLVEDEPNANFRFNSMIYSGIYNSRTGINQTNVFSVGEEITKSLDPANGSIQKLYAEDTNLIIFQESKVSRALIDKDAIYSAEGGGLPVSSFRTVIGQIVPYGGNYGIGTHPESFAVYGYNKYFVDSNQGVVLRLGGNSGIDEISSAGLTSFFRNNIISVDSNTFGVGKLIGGWDMYNKEYTLSIQPSNPSLTYKTLSFDERTNGWSSRYSYIPADMFSVQNKFFSANYVVGGTNNGLYEHYSTDVNRATFYNTSNDSTITSVFNANPSLVKVFQTINYEGGTNWQMESFVTNGTGEAPNTNQYTNEDSANAIAAFVMPTTLIQLENNYLKNEFKKKEDKYFANLINTTGFTQGEVVYGGSISGVKGYFATVKMKATNTATSGSNELFAISSNYKESSY